jgi:hypothetical protein
MTAMTGSAVLEKALKIGLAVVLLGAALTVRLHAIEQPLVTFRAIRHYRSAIIARAFYYHLASGIPQWAIQVADANRSIQQAGEPPIMEWLACAAYLLIGHENVAIPRTMAATAWVLGAIPLFFLARRFGSALGALVACTLYLFLPFGIIASRNFQPDALMTLAALSALVALVRQHEQPTSGRRATAIAMVGLATLIKPMSIFLTLPVLIALHLARLRLAGYRSLVVTLALCMVPAGLYYGYWAVFGNFVRDQMHMRFVPHLVFTTFFWAGLLKQIRLVFTLPLFLIAVVGVALVRSTCGRVMLAALWVGYAAFAFAFTYHMPTHDYYHWPYIAVVSLGVAVVVSRLEQAAAGRVPTMVMGPLIGLTCVVIAVLGTQSAWPKLYLPYADHELAKYREIGELAHHDQRVLFLDPEYGYPLMYHSEVSGDTWPNQDDLAADAIGGAPAIDANARFVRDYAGFKPHYFVVTDLDSLDAQPDLEAFLAHRADVVHQGHEFHVYRFKY